MSIVLSIFESYHNANESGIKWNSHRRMELQNCGIWQLNYRQKKSLSLKNVEDPMHTNSSYSRKWSNLAILQEKYERERIRNENLTYKNTELLNYIPKLESELPRNQTWKSKCPTSLKPEETTPDVIVINSRERSAIQKAISTERKNSSAPKRRKEIKIRRYHCIR